MWLCSLQLLHWSLNVTDESGTRAEVGTFSNWKRFDGKATLFPQHAHIGMWRHRCNEDRASPEKTQLLTLLHQQEQKQLARDLFWPCAWMAIRAFTNASMSASRSGLFWTLLADVKREGLCFSVVQTRKIIAGIFLFILWQGKIFTVTVNFTTQLNVNKPRHK